MMPPSGSSSEYEFEDEAPATGGNLAASELADHLCEAAITGTRP